MLLNLYDHKEFIHDLHYLFVEIFSSDHIFKTCFSSNSYNKLYFSEDSYDYDHVSSK